MRSSTSAVRFWGTVAKRAGSAAWRFAMPPDMIDVLRNIFVVIVPSLWWWSAIVGRGNIEGWQSAAQFVIALASVTVIFFILAFAIQLVLQPAKLWADASSQRDELKAALDPRITVALPPTPEPISFGRASLTVAGVPQVVDLAREHFIRLHVRNPALTSIEHCEAKLIAAARLIDGKALDLKLIEAIPLSWDRHVATPLFSVRIDPDETRCLYVGTVRPSGHLVLRREINDLPQEYARLFPEPGTYRLTVQLKAANNGPLKVSLDVETQAATASRGLAQPIVNMRIVSPSDSRISLMGELR